MKRRYINFVLARDWNFLFPEEEVKVTKGFAKRKAPDGSVIEINMAHVVAVEKFERDFEAEAEARRVAAAVQEAERGG